MLKYLAILAVLCGLTVYVAVQDERATQQSTQEAADLHKATAPAKPNEQHPQENIANPERNLPGWYSFFRWPNATTTWAILLTLMAIAEQTGQTRRAAEATEGAVKAAEMSYNLARDTSERELRAYLTVSKARLFLYDDGSIEPRLTISNSGQTPAYKFRGIQTISFDGHRHDTSFKPSDDHLLHYGTVGKTYRLTGQTHKVAATKQQVIDYLASGEMLMVLTGWYRYEDIFDKTRPLVFQLVIGHGGVLSRGKNSKHDWFVFFDDPMAGYRDQNEGQNPK